jgi:hypothetical protein
MTQDELRALVEQAHQLDELTKHPGWEVLTDFVYHGGGGSVKRQHRLVNGQLTTFEEYVKETGWLQGAHHVIEAPKTVAGMVATAREQLADMEEAEREQAQATDAP